MLLVVPLLVKNWRNVNFSWLVSCESSGISIVVGLDLLRGSRLLASLSLSAADIAAEVDALCLRLPVPPKIFRLVYSFDFEV